MEQRPHLWLVPKGWRPTRPISARELLKKLLVVLTIGETKSGEELIERLLGIVLALGVLLVVVFWDDIWRFLISGYGGP